MFNKKLLIEVLSIQSKSNIDKLMMDYLKDKTKKYKQEEDTYGNLYITKGNSKLYPCIVAHTDTVHKIHDDFKVFEHNDFLFAFSSSAQGQVGVGGDRH